MCNLSDRKCLTPLLSYSTVRLVCKLQNGSSSIGTGFFVNFEKGPVIVTNKHVVVGAVECAFHLSANCDGDAGQSGFTVRLSLGEKDWIKHPDPAVDLCCLPIAGILAVARHAKRTPVILPVPIMGIEGADRMSGYGQMDRVVMIGYPDALSDEVNNQPIFRERIIATDPILDFNGKKEFLIDMPVYSGSSGSPVFVVREGASFDRKSNRLCVANVPNFHLVGVVYATFQHRVRGRLTAVPIPTSTEVVAESAVPNNLGIVIKAERVHELNEELSKFFEKH